MFVTDDGGAPPPIYATYTEQELGNGDIDDGALVAVYKLADVYTMKVTPHLAPCVHTGTVGK